MKNTDNKKSTVEEAREYGIDISLLIANLRLTPTERIQKLQDWLDLYYELRKNNPHLTGQKKIDSV